MFIQSQYEHKQNLKDNFTPTRIEHIKPVQNVTMGILQSYISKESTTITQLVKQENIWSKINSTPKYSKYNEALAQPMKRH